MQNTTTSNSRTHSHKFGNALLLGFALLGVFFAGCQAEVAQNDEGQSTNDSADNSPKVISPSSSDNTQSPALAAANELDALTPEIVCSKFLNAMKRKDGMTAGQQLTQQALYESRRADLEMEAPGGPDAKYELGETYYATEKKKVAQVECFVEVGSESSKLMWILKKEKVGWKVSGMLLQPNGPDSEFLNFENRTVVEGIKLALQEYSDAEETRQANLPTNNENLK